ncbi:cytochrome P450 [Corynebacterium pilosum]|uniref:Cytochrome P450:oxidoreductase FAD/NAD(P)-binding protein n=1 Tax=Corynebacterium pilosum TaxID=35756 RepID=A0A376CLU8_9CORY|nr:cytochrome P450 [Corynebacterium pilosum]STC69404.1 cytochrome P450:oxidoreductase FAD/NAD(P)-binding protein [Corynebacterium pilosum]
MTDVNNMIDQLNNAGQANDPNAAETKCPYLNGEMDTLSVEEALEIFGTPGEGADADFDFLSQEFVDDPWKHSEYAFENQPVFYSHKTGYWVVTRYEDCLKIFKDTDNYTAHTALEKTVKLSDENQAVLDSYGYDFRDTIVNTDEPIHNPRRRALEQPFMVDELRKLEPMVRETVDSYIDEFIDDGETDIFKNLLHISPLTVALKFMGIPADDMEKIHRYSLGHATATWGKATLEQQANVAVTNGKFWQHSQRVLNKLLLAEEEEPGTGWVPHSIRAHREDPESVPMYYLRSKTMSAVTAAHDTTANSASNLFIYLLSERPDLWNLLKEKPELIPNAIEESFRLNGGSHAWRRRTLNEVEVRGVKIPAGERVLLVTSAANRDPEMFPDPHTFDLYRDNVTKHLLFGYGIHQCMGRNLARLQIQMLLQQLLKRLPHIEMDPNQDFGRLPSVSFRGPQTIKVTWDPEKNPERHGEISDENPEIIYNGPSRELKTREMKVTKVQDVTDKIRSITLEPLEDIDLPQAFSGAHIEIDAGGLNRQYSLVRMTPKSWEIAVQLEDESRGGSKWIHENVNEGSIVKVRGPRNNFRFGVDTKKLILVGAGIGITPMLAMADEAKREGIEYELHYSGSSKTKMSYLEDIVRDHGANAHLYISDEDNRMDISQFADRYEEGVQLLTCGPDRFTNEVLEVTKDWPEDTVRRESFTATTLLDPSKNKAFSVELNSTGVEYEVPANMTLLETLENAGVELYAECREGLCGTCEVGIISGDAEHRDQVLTAKEKQANNSIMTCVSRGCAGEKLVLDI